jgi:hypothetical protein
MRDLPFSGARALSSTDFIEIDFLGVETAKSGDAITIR